MNLYLFHKFSSNPTLAFIILRGPGRTATHLEPSSIIAKPSLLRRPQCYLRFVLPFPLATSSYTCLPFHAILLLPPLSHPTLPSARIFSSPAASSHIFIFPPTSSSCLSLLWCLNLKPNWIPAGQMVSYSSFKAGLGLYLKLPLSDHSDRPIK